MSQLGKLVVNLTAETVQFNSAMDKAASIAQKRMETMSRHAKIAGAAIGAALVAGATAFALKMNQIVEEADKMGKVAQSLGVTTEALSKLKYAADLSGVSFEELQSSINRLNRAAWDGNDAFSNLGIALKKEDGSLKNANELIGDIAEKFSTFEDGAAKAAIAQELFGRSGASLIPLLNQGRSGLEEYSKEAERLGIVISQNTARRAEEFKDNLTRLDFALRGVFMNISSDLLPALVALSDEFLSGSEKMNSFKKAGNSLAQVLLTIMASGKFLGEVIESIGRSAEATASSLILLSQGKLKAIADLTKETSQRQRDEWQAMLDDTEAMWGKFYQNIADSASKAQEKNTENMRAATISQEAYSKAGKEAERTQKIQSEAIKNNNRLMRELGATFEFEFENAIVEGKKFSDVLKQIEKDIMRIAIRKMITEPLTNSLFGGSGLFSSFMSGAVRSAHGNAFHAGNLIAFANGGVIGSRITFPMAGGKTGMAGENGPEAILPLVRTSGGDLGVKSDGGGSRTEVNIYAPPGSKVSEDRQQDGGIERINIFIDEATANNIRPGTKTYRALRDSFGLGQKVIPR
jgi:hypothetical protein